MKGRYDFSKEAGIGRKRETDPCKEILKEIFDKANNIYSTAKHGAADLERVADSFGEIQCFALDILKLITRGFDEGE